MPPELSTRTNPFNIVADFEQALRCLRTQLLVFKAEEGNWDEERPKKEICYKNFHTLRRFFFNLHQIIKPSDHSLVCLRIRTCIRIETPQCVG